MNFFKSLMLSPSCIFIDFLLFNYTYFHVFDMDTALFLLMFTCFFL